MLLTPHFDLDEFRCKCCGAVNIPAALELATRLEPVRIDYGQIVIDDSFRCKAHNQAVGGNADSAHLLGLAADLSCRSDSDRFALIKALLAHGFTRIGIAANYVHADIWQHNGPVIWTYYPTT